MLPTFTVHATLGIGAQPFLFSRADGLPGSHGPGGWAYRGWVKKVLSDAYAAVQRRFRPGACSMTTCRSAILMVAEGVNAALTPPCYQRSWSMRSWESEPSHFFSRGRTDCQDRMDHGVWAYRGWV